MTTVKKEIKFSIDTPLESVVLFQEDSVCIDFEAARAFVADNSPQGVDENYGGTLLEVYKTSSNPDEAGGFYRVVSGDSQTKWSGQMVGQPVRVNAFVECTKEEFIKILTKALKIVDNLGQ